MVEEASLVILRAFDLIMGWGIWLAWWNVGALAEVQYGRGKRNDRRMVLHVGGMGPAVL